MKLLTLIILIAFGFQSIGQNSITDSLKINLQKEKTDTGKAIILYHLSYYYLNSRPDSALLFSEEAYKISKEHKFLKGESGSLGMMAGALNRLGNFPKSLEYYLEQ